MNYELITWFTQTLRTAVVGTERKKVNDGE